MYKVISIEYAKDISQDSDQTWYRYIIANEFNTVTGLRTGTLAEVKKHTRLCVLALNQKYQHVAKKQRPKTYKPVNIAPQVYA